MKKEISNSSENKYTIPMLEKGLELIEVLAKYPKGITMQELIQILNQPKTSVYRLLNSLLQLNYISKNEELSKYFLSKKLLKLGLCALGESNIVELAIPQMQQVRDKIGESVMLGVFMNKKVVLLEQALGWYDFTFLLRPGTSFNLHASAPGKLFLAYSPEEETEELLNTINYQSFNKRTIDSPEKMRKEIKKIRSMGYAVDLEEEMDGVHCVGAPIFDQFGNIMATLWTSGPSGRLKKEMFESTASILMEATNNISTYLGYHNTNK